MFSPASAVVAHGFCRLKKVRENSRLERQRYRPPHHRALDELGGLGVERAALVDEAGDRLGEHGHEHCTRDKHQRDLADAVGHGGAQVVDRPAGGQTGHGRKQDRGDRDREQALGQLVDAKCLVDGRRRLI